MSTEERRKETRIPANFRTEILYDDHIYHGVIENLSGSGAMIVTDQIDNKINFRQYDPIELKFKSPSGEEFTIKCTIMWSSDFSRQNVRYRIGLELVGRPWDAISQFT